MSEIPEKILNSIDNYDVISFDIYDTLILRPYLNPNDRFLHIEKVLDFKDFAKKRVKAEYLVRQQIIDDEIQFDHIYQLLERKYQKAYNYELELETRSCQKNQEIYSIYSYALKQNKKIVFIEDIYLPYSMIENLLKKTGYTIYEYLFVSSYYKKTKASGDLFEELIYTLSVDPENVLHIGDDTEADYEVPKKIGINAILYPKVKDRFFEEYPNLCTLAERGKNRRFQIDPLTISVIYGLNILLWLDYNKKNYWYRFGHIYAAPLLYAFTQWVYNTAKIHGIKDIAFVARDGYNLIRIFKIFDSKKELNPQYVYLPRFVSETCMFKTDQDILKYLKGMGKGYENTQVLIKNFSETNDKIKSTYMDFLETKTKSNLKELKEYILKHKDLFLEESGYRYNTMVRYLKSNFSFKNDLLVVDAGCTHARPQKLLQRIMNENAHPSNVYGFYYKLHIKTPSLFQISMTPEDGEGYNIDNWALVEFFMTSPECPILSIRKLEETYKPVYQSIEDNPYEAFRIDSYIEVSKGVMDFARKAYDIFFDIMILDDLDTTILYINTLINNPSEKDIYYLNKLYHSPFNDNNYYPLISRNNLLKKCKKRVPKKVKKAFRYILNKILLQFDNHRVL